MSHRHRLDPPHLHYAATRLGEVVARDQMEVDAAAETINSWAAKATGVDRDGLITRLNWTMRDQAEATRRARDNAATAIRWAIRPLIRNGADKAEIEEAAGRANAETLTWDEIIPILKEEWVAIHAWRRRG